MSKGVRIESETTIQALKVKKIFVHPQVAQREQRFQLRGDFEQPGVVNLHMPELAFDHPEQMFDRVAARDARTSAFASG